METGKTNDLHTDLHGRINRRFAADGLRYSGWREMKTQCDRLLSRLEAGPVDPMVALSELGIYRLAARAWDLKCAGHPVIKQTVSVTNRFGEACRVAQYRLAGK